jgi:aconitase A
MMQDLRVGDRRYRVHSLKDLDVGGDVETLPYSLKVLLENLARHADGFSITDDDVAALAGWDPARSERREVSFTPARILLQDFTGVPAVVDLAAMRDAVEGLGGIAARMNPLVPVELVVDHSITAYWAGTADALRRNEDLEFNRNRERYEFLRWGQGAFDGLTIVPPGTGICHQVNLEHLARVVFVDDDGNAYPDTLVGTDSHTPMVNGLGVLGWGVGGIEAEAAMLGQPISMLTPQVMGFELLGALQEGTTATDLVLTVTELLRNRGVVGKFVEFFGPGVASVTTASNRWSSTPTGLEEATTRSWSGGPSPTSACGTCLRRALKAGRPCTCLPVSRCRSTTPPRAISPTGCPSSYSPGPTTGQGHRVTGPPKAPLCSACEPCSPAPSSASTAPTSSAWVSCPSNSPRAAM